MSFLLRLRPSPGHDPINALKWALKRLRDAGLTCTELTTEDNMNDQRMVKLATLWERRSAKGATYFSGFLGDCQLLLFRDGEKPHPTRPDETVIVWRLLVQERDQARRPRPDQDRHDPPAHGLAEEFDRRGPDDL